MVFFFGLAIKEVTEALLPGGSLSPLSRAVNLLRGWGVPAATDISLAWMFAVQIFGAGHPAINFLLLLALVDDAIGMIIIATVYPDPMNPVDPSWLLLVAVGAVMALVFRCFRVRSWIPYIFLCGPVSWYGLIRAHVHPALALVAVVPFMPATRALEVDPTAALPDLGAQEQVEENSEASFGEHDRDHGAPLHRFEHVMKVPVCFGMFFFGLSNAGVALNNIGGITAAVLFALVVGKTLGITGFSLLAGALGFPSGLSVAELVSLSALAGVGLTVALFMANEAFPDFQLQGQAKFAAVLSVLSVLPAILVHQLGARKEVGSGDTDARGEDVGTC